MKNYRRRRILFHIFVLFILLLLISDCQAGKKKKKRKKNKSKNRALNPLQINGASSSSKSSNKKKVKSKDPHFSMRNKARSGIHPLSSKKESITTHSTSKSTSATTVHLVKPIKKSLAKLASPTTSATASSAQNREMVTLETSRPMKRTLKWPLMPNAMDGESTSSTDAMNNGSIQKQGTFSAVRKKDSDWNISIPYFVNSTSSYEKHLTTSSGQNNPYTCEGKAKNRQQNVQLCGYPAIYNQTRCAEIYCSEGPLFMCENKAEMLAFGIIAIFLGISIIIGNSLLPFVVYRRRNMRSHQNYIKVSLAFADMLIGILLVTSVLPNMLWIRNVSEMGAVDTIQKERNSVTAVLAGSLLVVSFTSSLLHLTFLAFERLLALSSSFRHRRLGASKIGYCLIVIWMLSLLLSFTPAIFADKFEYILLPVLFVYMLAAKPLPMSEGNISQAQTVGMHGPLYGGVTMLLPYVLTVTCCVLTGIVVRRKLRKSQIPWVLNSETGSHTCSTESVVPARIRMKSSYITELVVFKTLLIMITAFSITILPIVVVLILFKANSSFDCDNYSLAYTLAFFASTSNSLVNVIIYTARDKQFRKNLLEELSPAFRKKNLQKANRRKQEIYTTSMNDV